MKALENIKVLDFTTLLPGPYATLMLADLGADVLKVSSGSKPDIVLQYEPFIEGTEIAANEVWLGRNKRNIFLNLKHPKALDVVRRLVKSYDVVVEQFRPGVMERLGLGYETLKKENPSLIYCSLTGYGQTGPMANAAGHDCNYMARSGNLAMAGYRDAGPAPINIQIADICSGSSNVVISILAAVNYRHMTGKGQGVRENCKRKDCRSDCFRGADTGSTRSSMVSCHNLYSFCNCTVYMAFWDYSLQYRGAQRCSNIGKTGVL